MAARMARALFELGCQRANGRPLTWGFTASGPEVALNAPQACTCPTALRHMSLFPETQADTKAPGEGAWATEQPARRPAVEGPVDSLRCVC